MFKYKVKCPACDNSQKEIEVALKLEKMLCRTCGKKMEIELINEGK